MAKLDTYKMGILDILSELPSSKLGVLAICPIYDIECIQFTQNVDSYYDLSEKCMLSLLFFK